MPRLVRMGRRRLIAGVGATAAALLAACASPAAPAATPVPAKPAEAPKPAPEPTKPAAPAATAATAAPAASKAPEPAKPAAAEKPGTSLIGKLEGYEILTDPEKRPRQFKEAPMLADLVKAGKLPPVEKRLPEEPLVVKPVHQVGKYGGTLRRGFTGPADGENGNRMVSVDKLLFWDHTGTRIMPSLARDWKVSEDGRTTTVYLRKGTKWSDGQPFTADDFVFWYEDLYLNKELVPAPTAEFSVKGKQGKVEKVDDYTVAFRFEEPYPMFPEILAGDTNIGRGQTTGQFSSAFWSSYAPRHYLKQFLPKYAPKEQIDKMVAEAKVDSWKSLVALKKDWERNPELPVVAPWRCVSPINTSSFVLERNPYYWEVDTDGNQLPYLDKVQMTLAENLEVLNLRAIAGEYDVQERHVDIRKLPVFLENQSKGGYKVYLDPGVYGSDTLIHINQSFEGDPEVAKWITNKDFRHALSLGIDRDQINEAYFLGLGTPGSTAPEESMPESPGAEWRKKWAVYDPKQANEILDKIGLDKKDSEGYRLRTDGKGRLGIELVTTAGAFVAYTQHAEMISQQWKKIGVWGDVKELERGLFQTRGEANQLQTYLWSNGGTELLYLYPAHALPVQLNAGMGPEYAKWYATNGQQGKEPKSAEMKKAMDMFRAAAGMKTKPERDKNAQEIWKIMLEEQWSIGVVGISPAFLGTRIASTKLGNIPSRQVNAQHMRTPTSGRPTTWFFK
jgi:peptide/nickel transport system substrate-binding protein